VVTLLTPDPLELVPKLLVVVVVVGVDAVVVLGVDATVLTDEVVEARLASAGSCPETSTIVIISQAATNRATAPEMMLRRILRARAARSLRSAWPRARAAAWLESVMVVHLVIVWDGVIQASRSASTPPLSAA
jgi:hypothetical protein